MRKIHVYFHVAALNHYLPVVYEAIGQLMGSSLYDNASSIFFGVVGGSLEVPSLPRKISLEMLGGIEEYEFPTIKRLWDDACAEPGAAYLYFHTKGVSRTDVAFCEAWRRIMFHHVITRWRWCLDVLDTHDTCGPFLLENIYGGNVWWANGRYLRTLAKPTGLRHDAEAWLLSGGGSRFDLSRLEHPGMSQAYFEDESYRT